MITMFIKLRFNTNTKINSSLQVKKPKECRIRMYDNMKLVF